MRAVLAIAGLSLATCVQPARADVPLPADVNVVQPGPDVPKNAAAFVGKWQGEWNGVLKAVLIVEEISGDKVKLVYAWDDAPAWRTEKGGAYHREGKLVAGTPRQIEFGAFVVRPGSSPDTLTVTRVVPTRVDVATFTRMQ